MELFKRLLEKGHPTKPASTANLASTFWNQSSMEGDRRLTCEVMGIFKRVQGEKLVELGTFR